LISLKNGKKLKERIMLEQNFVEMAKKYFWIRASHEYKAEKRALILAVAAQLAAPMMSEFGHETIVSKCLAVAEKMIDKIDDTPN
jgi:hypothetical protein